MGECPIMQRLVYQMQLDKFFLPTFSEVQRQGNNFLIVVRWLHPACSGASPQVVLGMTRVFKEFHAGTVSRSGETEYELRVASVADAFRLRTHRPALIVRIGATFQSCALKRTRRVRVSVSLRIFIGGMRGKSILSWHSPSTFSTRPS